MKTNKLISTFLAVSLAFALFSLNVVTVQAEEFSGTGWSFNSQTGTLTISSNTGTSSTSSGWRAGRDGRFEPSDVKFVNIQRGVTAINSNGFTGTSITSVEIPDSVTELMSGAFSNTGLTEVVIPDSVSIIATYVFYGCANLTSVTLPTNPSFTTLNGYTFQNTKLSSITIPRSVTTIINNAFGNTPLTVVTFLGETPPATIQNNAFQNATNIQTVYVPADSLELYKTALAGRIPSTADIVASGIEVEDEPWSFDSQTGTLTVTNSAGTTLWRDQRNFQFPDVKVLIIKDSVTSIENGAFVSLPNLTTVQIPSSVTNIANYAFDSTGLTSITFDGATPPTFGGSSVFRNSEQIKTITVPYGSLELYRNVLTALIPRDAKIIDTSYCGPHCKGTDECDKPCETPFEPCGPHCKGEDDCDEPCAPPFEPCGPDCKGEDDCDDPCAPPFEPCGPDCKGEGECDEPCEPPEAVFEPCGPDCKGVGLCDDPCVIATGTGWSFDFTTGTLTVTQGTGTSSWRSERGDDFQFSDVKFVNLQRGLQGIRADAFAGTSITSVEIPDSVTELLIGAFSNTGLTEVVIPDSVESIGIHAFWGCANLTSVTLPTNPNFTVLRQGIFQNTKLSSITIPNNVTLINNDAFTNTPLSEITFLSETPPSINDRAFRDTPDDMLVYVPAGAKRAYSAVVGLNGKKIMLQSPCGGHCKGVDECDDPCEPFEPCGPDCKGVGLCDDPCALPFAPCGPHCKGVGNCDEPCAPPNIFEPCGPACMGYGYCDEPCENGEDPNEYELGDCNNDGVINIADLTYLKYAIVRNNPEVFPLNPQCKVAGEWASDALHLSTLRNYLTGVIREFPDN